MSACMCNVFGRILWDDDFRVLFFSDPLAACRVFEGPTAQASGLRGLNREDFKALDEQLDNIRKTLGEKMMKEVANDFGLQMIIGRAMLEPTFGERLASDPGGVVKEFFGANESAKKAAAVLSSAAFRKLKGFAKHRKALGQVGAGGRFSDAIAHGRAFRFRDSLRSPQRAPRSAT
jgi:hypothetical protein